VLRVFAERLIKETADSLGPLRRIKARFAGKHHGAIFKSQKRR
jgi:hypothetical protein